MRRRNQSHPLARDDDGVDNDRHGEKSKLRFISGENPFVPGHRDPTVPVTQCNGLCHVTRNSQGLREACGGGRQRQVPGYRRATWLNRHQQIRLTPGHCYRHPTHCQERFLNPPSLHAVAAQGPRRPLDQQPRKNHLTPHHPKCPRMTDSTLRQDGLTRDHTIIHPPGTTRSHQDSTNCLRPPSVTGTVSLHPGCRSDSRRPPTPHERTLHAVTGLAHMTPSAYGAGP